MTDRYTEPDWPHSALIIIDVQRDFTLKEGAACIQGTIEVVPFIRRLSVAYRTASLPIIHIVRLYLKDGSNVDLCRRARAEEGASLVEPGTEGSQIVEELLPSPSIRLDAPRLLKGKLQAIGNREWILYKPRFGAFFKTPLEEHLSALGVNTVVLTGCNFPNCPRATLYEASERDFRIVLVKDAVSGAYDRGIEELQGIGVSIMRTDDCESILKSLTA
jgi:nicotinamidase-related amidase